MRKIFFILYNVNRAKVVTQYNLEYCAERIAPDSTFKITLSLMAAAHGYNFIEQRLAPANPLNDGKQTPFRGHPVFIA